MGIEVETVKPLIGARVQASPKDLEDQAVAGRILELLEERSFVVFPRINLSNPQQLALTDLLGGRVNYSYMSKLADIDAQDVYTVTLDPKLNPEPENVLGTFFWHMDGVNSPVEQPKATLLSCRATSPAGGQTEFASTAAAYEAMPAAERAALESLVVRHRSSAIHRNQFEFPSPEDLERWRNEPSYDHALVKTQPSGRKSLVIGLSADIIVGMPVLEGRALLRRLHDWCAQEQFTYRHEWQVGDLVIWNNRDALHRVIPYDRDSGRTMHRTSVAGASPNFATAA
jgi:alpha-ketoglutarate-dependent taurine dioxygenase